MTLIDHVETLIAATCIASANSLTGDPATIEKALGTAIAQTPGASNDALLWAWTEMGEIDERMKSARRRRDRIPERPCRHAQKRAPRPLPAGGVRGLSPGSRASGRGGPLARRTSRMDNLLLRLALAEDALGRGDANMRALAHEHSDDLQRAFR